MTLTDTLKTKGSPEWIEEDQIVSVQGHVDEDIIIELKLALSENYDDLQFELIRDGLPISSDRYQLSMRGNIVQLALKQSRKNDTGYYSLVATRVGQENDKGALKKIHLSISESNYEEGDPPVFLRRLSDLAVKVGTRTRFLVEIRSSTTLKIIWYKDDLPIHCDGPRFSLVHEGNFHCVDVAPVTIEDQGCWTCMAENHCGRSSCTSTLTVIVPKAYKKPEFVEELRALLTETGTVSLECKVIGVPTPVLRWFKDNKEIKAGDVFALTANPDDPTSLGVYTCEAVNCMGTAYSSSKVHVVGRGSREDSLKPADDFAPSGPLPIFKQILEDECCRIGDTIVLSCRVQVPPWPRAITWYNKEGRVEPSEKYHVIEDGIGGYSIEVKQVEAMDEGEWKCVATSENNMKQFTSCYVAMSIPRNYRKPRFMENLKAVLTEEGLVSFECKVVGFPTPLLRWFKDGQELKPGDVYQLTGTNSLGSYCCIARNCMGEAKSTAELTVEDIQNQLNEEERFQLLSTNQPPKFIKGLRSCEARINENFRFTVQVSVAPEPILSWYRDDALMDESDKYHVAKENLGTCHFEVRNLEFIDQAEWKCVAANDFGHSVTSCFLKLIIPKHYKKPKFLESLRAILSEEGAVNLECKVIGIPQPVLKWYKDNVELKPGDTHRIISGQDGTCCLGIYTCEATNCMGTVSSSASLLGFEDRKDAKEIQSSNELARNLSLSTIHEERTSQLYDTPQTDHSVTLDERGEVSFSFDGKEVSVSLYETPDLTEEEALQIVEMYADQLSEHVTEHNVIELPPMRFVKETSTTSNLLMEAVVIDVSPDYFVSAEDNDDLRTEADFEDVSIIDDVTHVLSSPERDSRSSLKRSARYSTDEDDKIPSRPPRKKSMSLSSSKSEKSQRIESESFHSAQKDEPPLSPLSSLKQDDSDTFADALSSAHLSITESLVQKHVTSSEHERADNRKRSLSAGRKESASTGSSLDDGIGGDSSFDSIIGVSKQKQRKKKQQKEKSNSEKYSDYERERSESEDKVNTKVEHQLTEPVEKTEMNDKNEIEAVKELFTGEEFLDNLKSVKEISSYVSEEIQELTKDILSESRTALRNSLELFCEKILDTEPQFSNIHRRIDDIYQLLENSRGIGVDIESLTNLEIPLHALLKEINEITSTEHIDIIRNILEPSIIQLSHVIENLGLLSLQPTLAILKKFNDPIYNISSETKELSLIKSISNESRNISEEIAQPLSDIQSMFNGILNYIEQSKFTVNGSTSPQQVFTALGLVTCLTELRECVSHTAQTAMTLKENETLNSLMELKEPLLDLQLILTSQRCTFRELSIIKEINFAIVKLKGVVITILKNSENHEVISRMEAILKILKDTDEQISKLMGQLSETEAIQKYVLKNLNVDQSLSNVHFALSSVLEKQENYITSCHLITSIEALRQTIGSSAVTIANLKNPIDDEIIHEIGKLNESLLNLQKDLLTEKHEPREEQILNDLINPISILKEIVHSVIESSSLIESIIPMLELLKDMEKDTALIAKEISKKKSQEESITAPSETENIEGENNSKSSLASRISRSLNPIKNWLSATSENSTTQYKDEIESALSSAIEELKINVSQIAIKTSYSEPPSDKSLIDALIDLREPLVRLKNAITTYHKPEDLLILKSLDCPMKYLLQTIMDVLYEHAEEKSLRPVIDIIEQIKNQISLSIEDNLYQQELKQNAKAFNMEMEEEEEKEGEASQETIPGTLTEVVTTLPLEAGSISLHTEQAVTENNSNDVVLQTVKNEKQEREEGANKLIMILSETLEKLQLEITNILEDFEESTTQTTTILQSKLANSIEELRRTISTVRVMIVYGDDETGSFEDKLNQTTLVLSNLIQPLTNIQNLLSKSHEHDVSELMILNRFTPLLNIIENNVIRQILDFISKDGDVEKEFEFLLCILEEIKKKIPIVIQDISLRRKILEHLRDISKPLESILERMSDLEKAAEETLETDVANILGKPIAALLEDVKITIQEVDMLDSRESLILELRNLLEPLLEFHSCLSMVQSSRRSLVPEASLLDERRSVILRAVDGLRKQVCHSAEITANMGETFLFNESLSLLNSAILQVQKQIGKTDYSRRSSSSNIPLQDRLIGALNRLDNAIIELEKHADKDTYKIVSKCLEALQKQISLAQAQFNQIGSEVIDEEAIVEGFLYPTNQLLSALNILKENTQKMPWTASHNLIIQLEDLADSISELSCSLSAHKTGLVEEGASEGAPIVETFSAVIDVLDHVKDAINVIEQAVGVEQKASMIITKVESVIDEIIEVSQEEIESVMMITEIPSKTIVQKVVQSEIENTPITTQISVLEDLEAAVIPIEQTKDDLTDMRECEENQKENEKQAHLSIEISKFNSAISNLTQPLKELINFVEFAKQKSLISKSEEDKRKIQELTALVQILNDLQATNISIKTVISASSSIILLDSQFSRMKDILANFEQAVDTVISLMTREGVKPELKETVMASLPLISKPLDALENVLASICHIIDENKYIDKDGESSSAIAKTLISCIKNIIKSLNEMQISKCVNIVNETEILKLKEETKDIEKTTARPLEELIEAIMESQEQIKCDKTSLLESSSLSTDMIASKSVDNLKTVEVELNKTLVKEIDDSIKQDAVETPQQAFLLETGQIEELLLENVGMIKSIVEPVEEIEKHSLATIGQQKIESTRKTVSENSMIQEKQIKVETLQELISSLQALCKSFNEIGEMAILESFDKKTIAFPDLVKPLLNLQLALPSNVTEDIEQNTMILLKSSIVNILEELQKSIATVQEKVQLNAVAESNSCETSKICLVQAVVKPLEDLKMSIVCIQSDPTINQFIQQEAKLSNVEQITILQNLVKSVEQFGKRFMSIISQVKVEDVPPLKIIKQKNQEVDPKMLHKIVDAIHILRDTFIQIENLNISKADLLETPEQKKKTTLELSIVIDSLEKLEQSLIIGTQQVITVQEEGIKEICENQSLLASANLKSVLHELRNSIIVVQEQTIFNDIPVLKTLNEALENLKLSLTTVVDHVDKVTETEKVLTLLSFANSVEEIANQLIPVTKQDIEKQTISETSLLKTMTIPIEELQSAILKLEDRVSQTLEKKESIKAVALECMIQPLQELQQSFLTASYQETVLALQRLPIKPILDNLNRSMAIIQDQIMIIQDNLLVDVNTDDSIILKDFARSLGNLRTSMVVLQQLNAIENASQQIVEIENASALQTFAKSIEEFKKCCCVIVERPRIIDAFTTNIELKHESNKIDTHLIENIIAPLRILREQILTIEETKMQESEILDVTEVRKPVTVQLSNLVNPLQQLEKSFVATVQTEHVIEHDGHNLITKASFVSLEKLALQPILEEVQKSIATVQEQVILEAGSEISEVETDVLLKSIAQPLVDLKTSIASIQQVTAIAPDFLNKLAQQQNISALETFAETLHNLSERIAMCNHQQVVIEPAADTISAEDAASLNDTWADVIDESCSKIPRPIVIDQGTIESPAEIAVSMSEDETSTLKTLAKPLTELRECLALIVEEQKTVPPYDTMCSLSEKENISLIKTMIQPLSELKQAAAIIIQEQMAIECANEHSFAIDSKNEFILRPLMEPLEELRHSIAVIQEHMLVETSTDHRSKNDVILDALAEPLFDLQRAISVLETRVMSPDVESMPEDVDNNWITKCLATPLHEIERSIADIRQCNIMKPKTIIVEEQMRASMQTADWSIIEKLLKPTNSIKSAILRIEDDSIETEILKTMVDPFTNVQENLMLLRNKFNLASADEIADGNIDAFIESLSNFEECISFIKKEIVDKAVSKQSDVKKIDPTISATLNIPLTELKCCIETIKTSPNNVHLNNLERPLELMQNALETIVSTQRNKKLSELSIKIINNISDINKSIESIENKLKQQQMSVVEIYIEYEALGILTKSLQNVKQCIIQIQEEPNTANLMISALQKLEKSIAIMREQSADKPLAEPPHTNFGVFSKSLIPCLHELQESIEATKTLWCEKTILDGLMILEKPIYKLLAAMNIMHDQSLKETILILDQTALQKKGREKEIKASSKIKTAIEKETNETIKEEIKETKLVKSVDSTITNDTKDKKDEKKPEKIEQKKEKDDEKLTHKEKANEIENKDEKQTKENVIQEIQKINEKQESKEIERLKEKAEQNEKSIKDKNLKQDDKEYKKIKQTDSFEKHKEAGKTEGIENQHEKINTVESVKNKIEESEKLIGVEHMRKEKSEQSEQKNKDIEIKEAENEQKKEQEIVQEKKKVDKCKRTEMDQGIKERTENNKVKELKDIGKKEEHLKEEKENVDKIEKGEEQKNIKNIDRLKPMRQYERKDKTEETEKEIDEENEDSRKKEEIIKPEEQKKKNEMHQISRGKEEERKETANLEEIKIAENKQAKTKKNVQEDNKTAVHQERDKIENNKAKRIKEELIERKKDELIKAEEIIQQPQYEYTNNIMEEDGTMSESRREINGDEEQKLITCIKQKRKEKVSEEIQELRKDENLCLEKWKQQKPQSDENWLYTREERVNRSDKRRSKQKEENDYQKRDNDKRLQRMEKRIRRDESARLLWEEEQRIRKRQEEERFRNRQRRKEQIRENEWSRKRENESDRFLRNMLETTHKPTDKLTSMQFFDVGYSREHTFRFDSGIPMLSSTSRSYSLRDSLTSLSRKRFDNYWDYKLHSPSMDKYYFDAGSSYRKRRKRENRMIRARSIGLLKYEDYSTGDSDATIVSNMRVRSLRRTKTDAISRINFDTHESNLSSYIDFRQNENLPWDKPKKPSFCTRLTNRVVGVGMRTKLACTVLGNPEPRIHWMKDEQKLDVSDNHYRMRYENGMAYLELPDASPEDAGIYTCVAENAHGTSTTESILRVYSDYKPTHSPPIFIKSIKDTYRYSDRKLILECRVQAHPIPKISWLKDGMILQGERYKQSYLDDDVYRLEIADPDITDNGQYTCRAVNELRTEEISHTVHVEDWQFINRSDPCLSDKVSSEFAERPQFSNLLKDYSVPIGGTIALQVEVKGTPFPEVKWLRGVRKEPITIPKARTFVERGLYTLIVPEATESEKGTYVCRAINAYGQADTSATVDVISSSAIDAGGKPAMFVSRPSKKSIDVIVGEDISISFRVSGIPKPRIIWMKGLTDITDGPRSYKESIDDYVRLTLKRVTPSDEGTYCILVKNRYGCDRSFFSIRVKQRARSLTPLSDWNSLTEREAEEYNNDMSYVRKIMAHGHGIITNVKNEDITISCLRRSWTKNCLITDFLEYLYGHRDVPGPISSEPVVIDGGKSWLSLSWGKAEKRGPAPVVAYKVEAWLLGSDGGARWIELGITPINAFDAFNLRPGGEYKFRVTPRNRYGWGEPVTMTNSVLVLESTDLPEFTKILPGQLKALEGTPVKLECEIRSDSKIEIRWYRETTEINSYNDTRFAICYDGSKCSLTIANIKGDDSGRYVCEANNKVGKVSSFARILVVSDPRIIEADAKLKTNLSSEPEDRPPQFTMRIRDRRVQTTYPVRLTCQVIGHPVPEITWYKNGTEVFQDDRHIFWDDNSNFHTLEIIHSTLEDSGCYMVTARNINGSVSCRCTLVVDKGIRAYIAPEFLRGLNVAYTIHSGGELRMSAQLEAYPSVGVVWHRDGIRLRPSRRAVMTLSHDGTVQFSLANVTTRDAGVYNCTATNAVGQTETATRVAVTVAIQDELSINESFNITSTCPEIPYSKEPLFVTKPLSTEAIEGDTVIILCEVVGDPKPEVIWLRDFLKPDYYRDAPHFRLVGAGPQYQLEIPYAKLDFTGTYSVIARNCHGEAKAVISLQIYAKGQGKEEQTQKSHGKVLTLPIIKRELRDLRCCDGDAVSLECKVYATPEPPLVRWERGGKIITMVGDFTAEFDGETARLNIQHVYPEDEGEYTCVAYNDLGKAYTSACLVVDVPEGKENILSQRLTRPMGLLSAGSTPRSTPRSTPIRSLSPAVSHGRELRSPQVLPRSDISKKPKVCPPKFYAVPHNRLVQEGETVRFQCAVVGHPTPWIRWDKNGTIVTPSARISIKERDDIKILEIIDVMREDAALYRMTAENDFGRIEASARLEVINRYESTSRTIRTRSASPRTYPSFDRSLLPTTSRINSRLQLECRVKGTPSVTPTWYRNGRALERSSRIKRHFNGITAKIEISKVKASDAGEYSCVATNILGSTKSSCQVTILDRHDMSVADKNAPRFLQSLPKESIVMENYCHEFQAGITGTPPFTITWYKDGRELSDCDYYKYIIYEDGGVALRICQVHPQDAGEYICTVQNDFGIASCRSLFAVQDYKDVFKPALQFIKTPLSVIAAKGTTACFCARAQCGKAIEIIWTINGKDARENAKCKIERDGNISILRIRDISLRDTGEIRCVASVNGKGPSISCIAKLQLQNLLYEFNDSITKLEDVQSDTQTKLSLTNTSLVSMMPEKMTKLSSLKCRQRHEKPSLMHTRSSSFPRYTASYTKHTFSPLSIRKRISNNASTDAQRSRFPDNLSIQRIIKKNLDNNLGFSKGQRLSSLLDKDNEIDTSIKLLLPKKMERLCHQNINSISNKEHMESRLEELIKATIIKEPTDIIVFRGSRAELKVTYKGCPEPTIKWFQVNRELQSNEKTEIVSRDGVSYLRLDDVTYDHAGKYQVSVENPLGKDRRFFSLAVEGPPEPLTDKPSINFSTGQTTIVWRSPPYDGGRTVIGYTVEAKRAGESTWMVIAESSHSLSHTVATTERNSVIPGENYCFRIRAENIHGLSVPGMESDLVRIPKSEEIMLQEEEDKFEPSFEARLVVPEDGKFFSEKYDVLEELGKGRYGVVKKVIERPTGMNFAAKFIKTIKTKDREQVREEIKIMNVLRHPKLLLLAAAYESPRETVLITEYISGGELFERVVADDFTLTERDSILFMRQICQGVEYMHENKIVHLDLKPENIMCRTRTSHQIKLIDFGLAQTLKSDTPIRVLFGTPEFIPPEIISYEPIGTESDMWSIGVICYVLLTGLSPFMGDNDAETFANITRADYDLEDEAFDAISNDAKNFISGLLIKRKELRMSATQCLEHPWMAQHTTAMSRIVLPTEKLKKFIIRRKWQKTGNAIRALGRMAFLSAHSRRSPKTTAESSPTLEQRFNSIEMQHSDGIKSVCTAAVDKDTEYVETSAEVKSAEAESQTNLHFTCVTKVDMTIQETSMKEGNSLNDLSKQMDTEKKMFRLNTKLTSKTKNVPQNVTEHLEILVSKENKKSDKEIIDKFSEIKQHMILKSQTLRRVFRGDSRDSGIGDCNSSSLMTSSLQVDELGIASTIEEELDHETHNRENKRRLKKEENRRNSTAGILASLVQDKKTLPRDTEITTDDNKVATKSDVTKLASCEINPVRRKVDSIDENTDTRILSRHNCDKFLPTGNVSRTAKLFERESERSNSDNSQISMAQRAYPAAIIIGKPHNERIQKAFAFWNK
ncbi:PREDICTED: titin-like [Wasmannia auropunctata]|uniref:titin-like n=1 Tax=Wasmannia auropunctata TaxID=64793 RepID=UPI0005F0A567|nr:PREDICTED: titin-like [Wasmannia auropunctata]